jgi:hypothetical protein
LLTAIAGTKGPQTLNAVERYRRSQGIRLILVSLAFVLLGLALRDEVPWYVTAFFAVCLVVAAVSFLGWVPEPPRSMYQLAIDDAGITRSSGKLREHVAWTNIARVRILTNDQGPQLEDVFFVIDCKDGTGCVVDHDLAVQGKLLEALQTRLPGLNNGAVIEAMTSVENREFVIWEGKE